MHTLQKLGLPKGTSTKDRDYYTTVTSWGALEDIVKWKSGSRQKGCVLSTPQVWGESDIQGLADILESITKQDHAKWRKDWRDTVIANPIETCSECSGVGIVETDSSGAPQYPKVCWKCRGVGLVKDIWDFSEYLPVEEIEKLAKFLRGATKISVK